MLNRRAFLLGLVALPAVAETLTIPCGKIHIPAENHDRAKHTGELVNLLLDDIEDMTSKDIGLNLARIKAEDKLYAKIQTDRSY